MPKLSGAKILNALPSTIKLYRKRILKTNSDLNNRNNTALSLVRISPGAFYNIHIQISIGIHIPYPSYEPRTKLMRPLCGKHVGS